ncbi:MATE family efflux transporter [Marininema halotolerans]|uniref:Multidrug export protein MepA n=1 Tax=Marininema halotolerans TaxID=1155944 RepID=A0A1I6PQ10_9BACL|nr:MATE family efflux transporter [Marininema halotolerans]SFS42274.1 putative efflux protein, MATE family [Marininema halotolerans]
MKMEQTKRLGEEKVYKLILQFSIPAIIAMLVGALYNVIDRIYIGNSAIGTLGIAGITICLPVMLLIWAFGTLIGVGGSSLVSLRLGAKKQDEAEKIMAQSLILLIGVSILITTIGWIFLTPILKFYGASSDVLPYAKDYMMVFQSGTILVLVGFGLNQFIRAEGNPKKSMTTMLIGPILNIFTAPIFIYILKWGMMGAALATIVAQAIATIFIVAHFFSNKSVLKFRANYFKPDVAVFGKILALGAAPFLMQLVQSIVTVLANNSLAKYGGDIAISAMGIVGSIQILITMPIMGINQGIQPIIGYNYGGKSYTRVKDTLKYALIISTFITVTAYIVTRLFSEELVAIFNNDSQELIQFGSHFMIVYLFLLPLIGMQIVGAGYFQAIGQAPKAMLVSLCRQVLVFIPALLILPLYFKVDGILYAGPVADFVAFAISGTMIWMEMRRLDSQSNIKSGAVVTDGQ